MKKNRLYVGSIIQLTASGYESVFEITQSELATILEFSVSNNLISQCRSAASHFQGLPWRITALQSQLLVGKIFKLRHKAASDRYCNCNCYKTLTINQNSDSKLVVVYFEAYECSCVCTTLDSFMCIIISRARVNSSKSQWSTVYPQLWSLRLTSGCLVICKYRCWAHWQQQTTSQTAAASGWMANFEFFLM